jgi:hypothetical protein
MDRRFLVRVYGDSLSMPRQSEGVKYFQTYPELLLAAWKHQVPESEIALYNRSYSDANAVRLLETYRSDAFYFGRPGGDIAILQCGIVDCAPRPIPPKVRSIVSRLPASIRDRFASFIHNNRAAMLRSGLIWRVTPPRLFLKTLTATLNLAAPDFSRVYVINIAPTTPATEARSPGLSESIRNYNSLIEEVVHAVAARNIHIIDVHKLISSEPSHIESLISPVDGHHISAIAHRLYADAILANERPYWQS